MFLMIVRLLFDAALVVLIWMTQRVVYPSFLHYATENLVVWHKKYIYYFRPIVMPLMVGQLIIAIYQVFTATSLYSVVSLAVVVFLWLVTFLWFVPIHTNIAKGHVSKSMLSNLVTKNWTRTIAWTFLFVYSLSETYSLM